MDQKKTIIFSTVFGVAAITGLIIGYLELKDSKESILPVTKSSLTIDVRTDGNTVQNNVYKYSFVVPQHWSLPNYFNVDSVDVFDPIAQTQKVDSELQLGMKVEVNAKRMQANQTLQSFANEDGEEKNIVTSSTITVSGVPAVQQEKFDGIATSYITYVKNEDVYISIVGFVGPQSDSKSYKVTYQELITSFKLL